MANIIVDRLVGQTRSIQLNEVSSNAPRSDCRGQPSDLYTCFGRELRIQINEMYSGLRRNCNTDIVLERGGPGVREGRQHLCCLFLKLALPALRSPHARPFGAHGARLPGTHKALLVLRSRTTRDDRHVLGHVTVRKALGPRVPPGQRRLEAGHHHQVGVAGPKGTNHGFGEPCNLDSPPPPQAWISGPTHGGSCTPTWRRNCRTFNSVRPVKLIAERRSARHRR